MAFRRARLQIVYGLLRGEDLETGQVSKERRDGGCPGVVEVEVAVPRLMPAVG